MADRALKTPNLQVATGSEAIIGGVRADWEVPEQSPPDIWVDGHFGFQDFKNLSAYLSRSVSKDSDIESLAMALKQAVGSGGGASGDV